MRINDVTKLEVHGDVGVLVTDSPPVNAISAAVRQGLAAGMASALNNNAIRAIVILCAGRTFYAGADITEFDKPVIEPSLHAVQHIIENSAKPVIAAIHGNALGGGLELALVAHYRIAVDSARLGLPEVNLGLLPGAGGTQRLPRLAGIGKALDMITGGAPVSAAEALEIGLIDAIEGGDLRQGALALANRVVGEARPLLKVRDRTDKLDHLRSDPTIFSRFRSANAARFGGFRAPEAIIACVEKAASETDFEAGLAFETHKFGELLADPQSAAMRHVFFAERQAAKVDELPAGSKLSAIANAALIGSELVGSPFASRLQAAGIELSFVSPELASADKKSLANIDLLFVTAASSGAEAFPLLEKFIPLAGEDTIFAIEGGGEGVGVGVGVAERAARFSRPAQLVALELFGPCDEPRLMEVTCFDGTAPGVLGRLMKLAKATGLVGVIAKEGSIARRLVAAAEVPALQGGPHHLTLANALAYAGPNKDQRGPLVRALADEGARMIQEGIACRASDIDLVAVTGLGWPDYLGGPMFQAAQREISGA